MTLHISSTLLASIEESAIASMPEECCGLLFGHIDDDNRLIKSVQSTANIAASNRHKRYEIDPQTVFDAIRRPSALNGQLIGFFHSHPDGSLYPSSHDVQTAWPDKAYLIVGIDSSHIVGVRSWRLDQDGKAMLEESIRIHNPSEP